MEPIIHPIQIYTIEVLDKLHSISSACIWLCAILIIITFIIVTATKATKLNKDDDNYDFFKKTILYLIIILVTSMVFNIFTPTKESIIRQKIAENITLNDIQLTEEELNEKIDFITNIIEKTIGEKSS